MIIGHRGVAAIAPENTLAGINAAAHSGLDWVELDTQLTADDVPVLFHDETVDRCTDGKGRLDSFSLEQLTLLDAGAWFNEQFRDECIPTLHQTLTLCGKRGMGVNLEIKCYEETDVALLVEKVAEVVKETQFPLDQLLLSSFSLAAIKCCAEMLPDYRVGLITDQSSPDFLRDIEDLELFSIHCDQRTLTGELAEAITQKGYQLNIWTLNDAGRVQDFLNKGVTHIITDDPELFSP